MIETLLAYISYDPVQRWGPVSPHGVGTALGFLVGAVIMARRAEPRGIPRQETYNAVTWGAVGAIIGARGFYVLAHADQFRSFRDVIAVWEGGLTMFGGFVGGLLLGLGYLRRRGFDIPKALDAAAPGFVAGVFFGRVGDLIIADHLGEGTDFFGGYQIPEGAELAPGYGPPTYVPGAVVHQTALYDLIGVVVLAGFMAWLARRRPSTGTLFATFALWYGLQRFVIDFTRNTEVIESFFFGLSGSQWAGLGFAVGGAVWLWMIHTRPEAEPTEEVAEPPAFPTPRTDAEAYTPPPAVPAERPAPAEAPATADERAPAEAPHTATSPEHARDPVEAVPAVSQDEPPPTDAPDPVETVAEDPSVPEEPPVPAAPEAPGEAGAAAEEVPAEPGERRPADVPGPVEAAPSPEPEAGPDVASDAAAPVLTPPPEEPEAAPPSPPPRTPAPDAYAGALTESTEPAEERPPEEAAPEAGEDEDQPSERPPDA